MTGEAAYEHRYADDGVDMIRIVAIVPVLILASMVGTRFVSNKDGDRFETLAAQGLIEEGAPVKAASEIVIKAPPEKVWAILTNIDRPSGRHLFQRHTWMGR